MLVCIGFYAISVHADSVLSCDTENSAITATTTHLTDNNDGTITDPESGLIWKKCSEGQSWSATSNNCTGTADIYTWQAALQRAQAVNVGSGENFLQIDWRVPNINELDSIAELRCENPAINKTVFPNTPADYFWSSSPYAPISVHAWSVYFVDGVDLANGKPNGAFVRLVRIGQ